MNKYHIILSFKNRTNHEIPYYNQSTTNAFVRSISDILHIIEYTDSLKCHMHIFVIDVIELNLKLLQKDIDFHLKSFYTLLKPKILRFHSKIRIKIYFL